MKNLKAIMILGMLSIMTVLLLSLYGQKGQRDATNVTFRLATEHESIVLGQPMRFELTFENRGGNAVQVPIGGVMSGNVEILIAAEGERFRRYSTAGWGRLKEVIAEVKPSESRTLNNANAKILWNARPDYSHLNKESAEEFKEQQNRIPSYFAFEMPGVYKIKASACLISENGGCNIPIESEVVQVVVQEPLGEDLAVWNAMKDNPKVALFIQTAGSAIGEKDLDTLKTVESLTDAYPNSRAIQVLQSNLKEVKSTRKPRNE